MPVNKLSRSKYWIVIAIVSVLVSCGGDITFRIIDVSLIDQPVTFAKGSDTITVVGLLKATIETDFDVIE